MKKVKKEGNVLFLSQNRMSNINLFSDPVDNKIAKIMLPKVLASSDQGSIYLDSYTSKTPQRSKTEYLYILLKLMLCVLFFISLVLASANLSLMAIIPNVSAGTLGVLISFVVLTGGLFAFSVREFNL